jgi:hypothetical protein
MTVSNFAQLLETSTPSLWWGFPILIALFLLIYSPVLLLVAGLIGLAVSRTKKQMAAALTAKALIVLGCYYAVWYILQRYILVDINPLWSHMIFTSVLGISYLLVKKSFKKQTPVLKTVVYVLGVFCVIYLIEILGLVGAAVSK